MSALLIEFVQILCLSLGIFLMLTGALGLFRMPDFYTRIHPAGIADGLGAPLILLSIAIGEGWTLLSGKIGILILCLWMTSPTATHAIAKAAALSGIKPQKKGRK